MKRNLWFVPFLEDRQLRPWQVMVLLVITFFGIPLLLFVALYETPLGLPKGLGRRSQ